MENLTSIIVDENNQNFLSYKGIFYTKSGNECSYYPKAKKTNDYFAPLCLIKIWNNYFFYTKELNKIYLQEDLTNIREAALANSNIKEIYFTWEQQTFSKEYFQKLNLTAYYPKGNSNLNVKNIDMCNAACIVWKEWVLDTIEFDDYLFDKEGTFFVTFIITYLDYYCSCCCWWVLLY